MRKQIAAAAGITAALVLAGCGTTAAVDSTPAASPPAVVPAPPAPVPAGTTVTVSIAHLDGTPQRTVRIRMDKVTEPAPPDPAAAMPDGTNLLAAPRGSHIAAARFTWTVTASDDERGYAPSSLLEFGAKGSDGHRYAVRLGAAAAGGIDTSGVDPALGETADGTVSFTVPDGARLVSVTYSPLGGGSTTWAAGR